MNKGLEIIIPWQEESVATNMFTDIPYWREIADILYEAGERTMPWPFITKEQVKIVQEKLK